ncbi:RHS repeat domain-containing protein, partial [Sphingomonadaceae bacterium jetA1]|uniref:RHS repeat domain-containing protein n=1 Tax=Facivitalis istanbulensis TaxID=3075838 RepID=UPI00346EF151
TLGYQFDANDNRTRMTYPDGTFFTFDYDSLDRRTAVRENGGTVGGFNRLSQRFAIGGARWTSRSGVPAVAPGHDCGRRAGRRLPTGKSVHCSGGM